MKQVISLMMLVGSIALQSASAANLGARDVKYVAKSTQGLIFELKTGALAQERAGDQRVKDFGKLMVTNHGKDLEALKRLAERKKFELPQAMNKGQREETKKLSKLSGRDFDREYVKYEVKDHREDIKDQEEQIKKTSDPDLKDFAKMELDTVIGHKQKVDMLQAATK